MAVSTESSPPHTPAVAGSRRARRELLLEWVFRPLSGRLVPLFERLRVPPTGVVLANGVVGLLAADAIARDQPVAAALLLQLKTLLDNSDGQLARVTDRVSLTGRYLDTQVDLVVNAAVFLALAALTGLPALALASLAALTFVLAVDFNVSELAQEAHGVPQRAIVPTGGRVERVLDAVYRALFSPQDRLVRFLSDQRFRAVVGEALEPAREAAARRAYFDGLTLAALANFGLTTQLAVLGVCLVLGIPALYLWFCVACAVALVPLQVRREGLARRAAA